MCVARTNDQHHFINQLQIHHFTEARGQLIYVFPTGHFQIKKKHDHLRIDKLLTTQDSFKIKESGLFLYTQEMPVMILYNVCISLGLVNRAKGTAAGIVHDPNGKLLIHIPEI